MRSSSVMRSYCDGLWSGQFFSVFGECSTFVPGISSTVCCEAAVVEYIVSSEIHCRVFTEMSVNNISLSIKLNSSRHYRMPLLAKNITQEVFYLFYFDLPLLSIPTYIQSNS